MATDASPAVRTHDHSIQISGAAGWLGCNGAFELCTLRTHSRLVGFMILTPVQPHTLLIHSWGRRRGVLVLVGGASVCQTATHLLTYLHVVLRSTYFGMQALHARTFHVGRPLARPRRRSLSLGSPGPCWPPLQPRPCMQSPKNSGSANFPKFWRERRLARPLRTALGHPD